MALPHAAPGQTVHLEPLGPIPAEKEKKTTALVKTDRFEAVHLVLRSGAKIAPHAVEGHFTLQCLEGAVTLTTSTRTIDLRTNDWVYLGRGEQHGLEALEDSSLLLTILFEENAQS